MDKKIMKTFKQHLTESIKPQETEYEVVSGHGGLGYTFWHEEVMYVVGFQSVSNDTVTYGFSPVTYDAGIITGTIDDNKVKDIRLLLGKIMYITYEYLDSNTSTKTMVIVTNDKKKNRLYKRFLKVLKYKYHEDVSVLDDQTLQGLTILVSYEFDVNTVQYLIINR